jgi:hypothetical protein
VTDWLELLGDANPVRSCPPPPIERLRAQLGFDPERGWRAEAIVDRRSRRSRRIRMDVVAVALGVAVVVAVAAVFVGLGTGHRLAHHVAAPPVGSTGRRGLSGSHVIKNYAPGRAPALGGQRMWKATLHPPGDLGFRGGTVIVNKSARAPTRYLFSITASGLPPTNPATKGYAVWIVPAVQTSSGAIQVQGGGASRPGLSPYAELVGVIKPGPANGRISAEGVLPADASGANLLIITPSGPIPTRIILKAYIEMLANDLFGGGGVAR